jgi:amino acid transporter
MSELKEKEISKLSLFLAVVLGINAVIGAGVFTMPITLFKLAGPAGIISVIIAAICVLFMGFGFARITSLIPETGGFYTYVSSWGGKNLGAIASFLYLSGLTIAMGLLARYVSNIIAIYMTSIDTVYIGYSIVICTFIATLFASSIARVGQTILFILTIMPILFIGFLCNKTISLDRLVPFFSNGMEGVFAGLPVTVFSFLGFESISSMTRIIKNPQKNIPIATLLTIIVSSLLYIFFVFSVISGIDSSLLLSKNLLSEVLLNSFSEMSWIIHFINASIIITILGTIYALMMSLSELLIGSIKKISNDLINIPETLSVVSLSFLMAIFMRFFTNIGVVFNWIAMCVSFSYLLTLIYLLVKPKNNIDIILGIFGTISASVLIFAAILQLI